MGRGVMSFAPTATVVRGNRDGARTRTITKACFYHSAHWYDLTAEGYQTIGTKEWPGGITIATMERVEFLGGL